MDLGSGLDDCKGLALAALAALEMDKLDRVVELANRISGPLQENGFCDYLLGTVLARQGEHEHALQIALSLYGVDVSRRSSERLRRSAGHPDRRNPYNPATAWRGYSPSNIERLQFL